MDVKEFFMPRSRYRGAVKPENLLFNANLQEFSQRVTFISGLETNGKLSPEDSYQQISALWEQLSRSYHALAIGRSSLFNEQDEE
ncbi:MAG: hypothetical protein NW220_04080 [Leptolyngbyaceae cyanobacterium bins.349]|nr:hypothetical protein [Leptolyngbyaceae cyanobacterium bins.349]